MNKFDYFVSGEDVPGIVYHNRSMRYEKFYRIIPIRNVYSKDCPVIHQPVTIKDYRFYYPQGEFHVDPVAHEIREYFPDGSYEIVANSGI